MTKHNDNILEVAGLKTHFFLAPGVLKAVDGVDFSLQAGKALAIIGESGSGKSVAVRSIMRIVTPPGKITAGSIMLKKPGQDPLDLTKIAPKGRQIRSIRGGDISMIFQ